MNCENLQRWLDDGMPEEAAAGVRAHVASCPRCAAALRAETPGP